MDSTAVLHRLDQAILRWRDMATAWSDLIALCRAESGGDDAFWDRIAANGCADDLAGMKKWIADSLRKSPPPAHIVVLAFIPSDPFGIVEADGYEFWDNIIDRWNWPDVPPYQLPGGFRPAVSSAEVERIWEAQRAEGYKETLAHEAVFVPFAPMYMVSLLMAALSETDSAVLLAGAQSRRMLFTIPESKSIFLLGTATPQGFQKATQEEFDKLKATDNWHERKGALPTGPAVAAPEPEPSFMSIKPAKPEVSAKEMAASLPPVPGSKPAKPAAKAKPAPAKKKAVPKKAAAKKPAPQKPAPKKAAKKPAPKKAAKKSAAKKAGGKSIAAKKAPAKKAAAKKPAPKKAAKKPAPQKAAKKAAPKKSAPAKKAQGKPAKKKK